MLVRGSCGHGRKRAGAGLQNFGDVAHDDKLAEHNFPMLGIGADVFVIAGHLRRGQFQRFLLARLDQFG